RPQDYLWSSIKHHLGKTSDPVVDDTILQGIVNDWNGFLDIPTEDKEASLLQLHTRTGRPLGGKGFIGGLEKMLKISLRKKRPGPKVKKK
ncbi:MAG: transposase, partial [Thermodesulfobacteriota bacterium]|nr:transposase [Thermodesulfobacteriota bacterium]